MKKGRSGKAGTGGGSFSGTLSASQYYAILAAARDGFWVTGAAGEILEANEAACQMLGYDRKEFIGMHISAVEAVENPQDTADHIEKIMRQGSDTFESRHRKKDGTVFPVEVSVNYHVDENGKGEIFAFVRDISARKQAEEELAGYRAGLEELVARRTSELQQALEKVSHADRLKSDFIANVSHELRTPMSGVIGITELLLDSELDSSQREQLQLIYASASALLVIINDLLDFSRIAQHRMEICPEPFELRKIFGDTINFFVFESRKKNLPLIFDVAPDVPDALFGDQVRLRQVLVNLIGNAIKFTEAGHVSVTVRLESLSCGSARILFSVADTGIGIHEEHMEYIFDAFTQADSSRTRKYGGTGLGLAISHRIVHLLGGELEVESAVGEGSRFFFTVPLGIYSAPP